MRILVALYISILSSCNLLGPQIGTSNIEVFDDMWSEYNKKYALFDIKGINWQETYDVFRPQINNSMSDLELHNKLGEMLTHLNDSHVSLTSTLGTYESRPIIESDFELDIVKTYIDEFYTIGDKNLVYGKINSIGYLYIRTFAPESNQATTLLDWALKIDDIINYLENCPSVIIDVRGNGGGLPQTGFYIANRFADKKRAFQIIENKNGPDRTDFSDPRTYDIKPEGSKQYKGNVFLLTDTGTLSAAEGFTMAMKTLPNVTQVGVQTGGIFSLALARDTLNGWIYRISVQKITDMNGICYEGTGMFPSNEYYMEYDSEDKLNGIDTQLEFILNL